MSFLAWHYTTAFRYFLKIIGNYLAFIFHYFSISFLLKTLFWRFRRLDLTEKRPGFHLEIWLSNLIENFVSRLIGFICRTFIIFVGAIVIFVYLIAALFALTIYLLFPLITFPTYFQVRKGDKLKVKSLEEFFNTTYGKFFLDKIGAGYAEFFPKGISTPLPLGKCFVGERSQLFLHLCETWEPLKKHLMVSNLSKEDIDEIVSWYKRTHSYKEKVLRFWDMDNLLRVGSIGSALSYGYTNFLDQYCLDLTKSYLKRSYYNLYGRGVQLKQLEESLLQSGGNDITIVTGVKGVGKHSLIYNLAEKIDLHHVPIKLRSKRVLMLNTEAFLSVIGKEAVPARFIEMMEESGRAGNVIVVIDAFEKLLSSKYGVDLFSIFAKSKNYEFPPVIGVMEISYFNEVCAGNDLLNNLFTTVKIEEVSKKDSLMILEDFANEAFYKDKVITTFKALKSMVELADKFLINEPKPERSVAVFNRVLASVKSKDYKIVNEESVREVVSRMVGVPVIGKNGESRTLLNLEKLLHERIIDQEPAISIISKAARRVRTGVSAGKRPSGAFLFLGPTGVGKTETAKALADIYFGSEKYLMRFDMAEFKGESALERLIGSFKSEKPGVLTSTLKNNPFGVLLLDEIEKAEQGVLNLLLTVLDEGYITDAFGNKVSAENLIIIATSNAGAEYTRTYLKEGRPQEKLSEELTEQVLKERIFSPEFINRFDAVVVYKPLSNKEISLVAGLMLKKLVDRVKNEKGIVVQYDSKLVEKIIKEGYDPVFGGRSVRRYIQNEVEDRIAREILEENLKAGDAIKL